MRRTVVVVAGWVLAAAAVVLVGVLTLSLLGPGVTGQQVQVLSERDVNTALRRPAPDSSTFPSATSGDRPTSSRSRDDTSPSPSASTSDATVTRALSSEGGTVVARCHRGRAYLVSWTPRQGFEIDDPLRGPATTAYVKFESDDLDVHVTVGCRAGTPVSLAANEPDD